MSPKGHGGDELAYRGGLMNRESERLTPLARQEGLVIQRLDHEVLVYDLARHVRLITTRLTEGGV
jgi:hypothetical protein